MYTKTERVRKRDRKRDRNGEGKREIEFFYSRIGLHNEPMVETCKFKLCRIGGPSGDPGKSCSLSPVAVCLQNSKSLRGEQDFYTGLQLMG